MERLSSVPCVRCVLQNGRALEFGCWAHARRDFIKAEKSEPDFAREAIARIGELYASEARAHAHVWKVKWAKVVGDHRASILQHVAKALGAKATRGDAWATRARCLSPNAYC